MNDQPRSSRGPAAWLLAAFLTAQLGLLWVHGAMLQRQQQSLQQIHEDLQELAEAVDAQQQDGMDQGDSGDWAPAHASAQPRARARYLRVRQDPQSSSQAPAEREPMDQGAKDAADANKSAQDAVAKARKVQSQLSIEENYRKGQQQRAVQEAQYEWTRWVWAGLGVLVLAFLIRYILQRRG